MPIDPITEEIRRIRRMLAEKCNNDVSRILSEVRQREASSEKTFVRLPKRPARPVMAEQRDEREPE